MLTGPGPLTATILKLMKPLYSRDVDLYYEDDDQLSKELNTTGTLRVKIYGYDMENFCKFKSDESAVLYKDCLHWVSDPSPVFRD